MRSADEQAISISVVAMGELLVSIEKSGDVEARLELETVLHRLQKVPIDERIARRYGELRADLEIQGQRMSDNDLWIAATALIHDAILVTADEAFSRVPGLTTENWGG